MPLVDPRIAGIGIMTANRPALLERALKSYAQFATANRSKIEYVVFDDSKEIDMCNANRHVADRVRQQYDVPVRFAGCQEKATYVKQLGECLGHSRDILQRSLMRTEGYTLGQNRNALLLDSIGSLYFSADDDTICSVAIAPDAQQSLRLSEGIDPCSYWCYQNTTRNGNDTELIKKDVLDTHGQLLGRRLSEIISSDFQQITEIAGRLNKPESSVRITVNGLLGDCGWGAPFGLWHQPMGYLAFDGASLERLIHDDNAYRQRLQTRQVLRVTTGPVLADFAFSMLTTWGFDNRQLLPPNLPTHRGQDLIFGQVLSACSKDAVIGHLPFSLIHDPVPIRRFWPGEITRTAAGIDLCRLMVEAITCCSFRDSEISIEDRLMSLGRHLIRLAALPGNRLRKHLSQCLQDSNQCFEQTLMKRAMRESICNTAYANDVTQYFNKLRTSQSNEDYWLPLDLRSVDGVKGAEARTRQSLREFGELLETWPAIIHAAKTLRNADIRLSVPR
ncbi:MAG: hypothetical protein WBM41_01495 [Arenicellales bacterium]